MQRLIHALSRRRRGRPAPVWRARPYRPTIDIRLTDIHGGLADGEPSDQDAPPRLSRHREVWEL
jgi:hypothetical protein